MGRREVSGFYSSLGRTREKKIPFFSFYILLSAHPSPKPRLLSPCVELFAAFRPYTFVAFTDFVVERLSFVGETWFFVKTATARGCSVVQAGDVNATFSSSSVVVLAFLGDGGGRHRCCAPGLGCVHASQPLRFCSAAQPFPGPAVRRGREKKNGVALESV